MQNQGQLVNRPVFYLAKALLCCKLSVSAPILLNFSILGSILLQLRVKARSYLLGQFLGRPYVDTPTCHHEVSSLRQDFSQTSSHPHFPLSPPPPLSLLLLFYTAKCDLKSLELSSFSLPLQWSILTCTGHDSAWMPRYEFPQNRHLFWPAVLTVLLVHSIILSKFRII